AQVVADPPAQRRRQLEAVSRLLAAAAGRAADRRSVRLVAQTLQRGVPGLGAERRRRQLLQQRAADRLILAEASPADGIERRMALDEQRQRLVQRAGREGQQQRVGGAMDGTGSSSLRGGHRRRAGHRQSWSGRSVPSACRRRVRARRSLDLTVPSGSSVWAAMAPWAWSSK